MYSLFAAPPDRDLEWQEEGVAGISRFLARVYRLAMKYAPTCSARRAEGAAGQFAGAVAGAAAEAAPDDCEDHRGLQRAVALQYVHCRDHDSGERGVCGGTAMDSGEVDAATIAELLRTLTLLLVPFAPFLAAELWKDLGETTDVFLQPWPVADAELARESEIEIPVQVNGKLANVIKLAADADEAAIMAASLADEKVAARLEGKTIVKHLVINKPSGKLVNLVVSEVSRK